MSGQKIVILATGGTIAGTADSPDAQSYRAAQLGIHQLLGTVPALAGVPLITEQVAQIDSKDMDFSVLRRLAARCTHWLAQPEVKGIVVTHGTDTLEETAYFLQAALAPAKPVVLACAMRPATAPDADGPRNLADAATVAFHPLARGVVAVCAGVIHGAFDVAKVHPSRLDAFSSGDAGPLGFVEAGQVRMVRPWPQDGGAAMLPVGDTPWPRVEIVMNYAGADGTVVDALLAQGVQGLVVAGTGNGTLHQALETALLKAVAAGVPVVRTTRCERGRVVAMPGDRLPADERSPVKARIAMMLRLAGSGA